jgi:cell division protein FtsB
MSYWSTIYRFAWIALAVLVLIGMGFMFVPLIQQDREFQRRENELRDEIQHSEERIRELRLKQERFQSDPAFIERVAHEMGFAKPNETIFRFIDDED